MDVGSVLPVIAYKVGLQVPGQCIFRSIGNLIPLETG